MLQLILALQSFGSRLNKREEGGVVIEYGVVVAVIALGLVAVGLVLVGAVGDWFGRIADYVNTLGAPQGGGA